MLDTYGTISTMARTKKDNGESATETERVIWDQVRTLPFQGDRRTWDFWGDSVQLGHRNRKIFWDPSCTEWSVGIPTEVEENGLLLLKYWDLIHSPFPFTQNSKSVASLDHSKSITWSIMQKHFFNMEIWICVLPQNSYNSPTCKITNEMKMIGQIFASKKEGTVVRWAKTCKFCDYKLQNRIATAEERFSSDVF